MIAAWAAALSVVAGALCIYLAAPHQALFALRARRSPLRAGGVLLLILALALLMTVQGPATAVFTWATGAMLVWSVVPVVVGWWHYRRETTR